MTLLRVLALVALLTLVGCATTTTAPQPQPWESAEREAVAERIATHNVEIVAGPHWTIDELDAVETALTALPELLLPTAENPLSIARVDRPCVFGAGRYSKSCPTFSDDGTLLLYDIVVIVSEGPTSRLEMLSKKERHRLLRMRAVAHGLLARADEEYEWSSTHGWRQINGWSRLGDRPQNRHPAGYLNLLGRRTSHLDLVTSAEAFFFREEDLALRRDAGIGDFDADLSFTCQEFTRSRVLSDFFDELDPNWRRGTWRADEEPAVSCDAFETWAELDHIEGIDILFAAEQSTRPESLFGHLLLHVRHESHDLYRSEGFEYVYQFGAVTDTDVDGISYLIDGMTGSFLAIFDLSTFRGIDFNYLQLEQRTLRRYALHLDDRQTRHLLERIWESERRVAYPYYFSTQNCASMLLDLMEPVLGSERSFPRRPLAMPTEVLDSLAQVEAVGGGPMLERRSDDVFSAEERALTGLKKTREITATIEDDSDSRLVELLKDISRRDLEERDELYTELAGLLVDEVTEPSALSQEELLVLTEAFIDIERAGLERANAEVVGYHERALTEDLAMTQEEVFELRRKLYSHEDLRLRSQQLNDFTHERSRQFRLGERHPPTTAEDKARRRRDHHDRAYQATIELQGLVIDELHAHSPEFNTLAHLNQQEEQRQTRQRRLDQRSLTPSNSGRVQLGIQSPVAAVTPPSDDNESSSAPLLDLRFSVLDDRLGQRRLHGHRPLVETVGFSGRLRAPIHRSVLENLDFELTLVRYITLTSALQSRGRGFFKYFGWGTELDIRVRHHDMPLSAQGFFGFFLPILTGNSGIDHLALGLGPAINANANPSTSIISGGLQTYLLARKHLGGTLENAAFLRFQHTESLEFSQFTSYRGSRLRGGFEFFIPIAHHGILATPYVEGELQQFMGTPGIDDRRLLFGFQIEALRQARP